MMYPRLFLARNLLTEDGVIFISIDDNEQANLKKICDQIFGEDNFVASLIWNSSTGGGIRSKFVNQSHQYILCYSKNQVNTEKFFSQLSSKAKSQYKKKDATGIYREKDFAWKNFSKGKNQKYFIECPSKEKVKPKDGYLFRFVRTTFEEYLSKNMVVFKIARNSPLVNENGSQSKWNIYIKKYLGDGTGAPISIIPKDLVGLNNEGTTEVYDLFKITLFSNPKNVRLIKYLLNLIQDTKNDIILDFFAGSCTTADAVMQLNAEDGGHRKFIMVQLPELCKEDSEAFKSGYKNISEIGKERIRRAAQKIKKDLQDKIVTFSQKVAKLEEKNKKTNAEASQEIIAEIEKQNQEILTLKERAKNLDLGFQSFQLTSSNFEEWQTDPRNFSYCIRLVCIF